MQPGADHCTSCRCRCLCLVLADPIKCDSQPNDAIMSGLLHGLVGVVPHACPIWVILLSGCRRADNAQYALHSEEGGKCEGPHWIQAILFALICLQSTTWFLYCTAWYHELWTRRLLRHLSMFFWRLELWFCLAYIISYLLWLLFAVLVDPVGAAVPIIYIIAIVTYISYAITIIREFTVEGGEGAKAFARTLIKSGIEVSRIVALVVWGLALLLVVLVWLNLGFAVVHLVASDGAYSLSEFWGSIVASVSTFAASLALGRQRYLQVEDQLKKVQQEGSRSIKHTKQSVEDGEVLLGEGGVDRRIQKRLEA